MTHNVATFVFLFYVTIVLCNFARKRSDGAVKIKAMVICKFPRKITVATHDGKCRMKSSKLIR